ncbi:hypothetical protein ScPMuIL_007097 [Solemya velum]
MEKKSNARTSSVPPRASGAESKKNSDNGASSKYTKYPKKKEGGGNKQFQDGGRRPIPQRTKSAADKRPRFRGTYPDRPRNDVVEDICPELGSAVKYGTRKVNLNHLLNFTLARRETYWGGGSACVRPRRSRNRVFYNKERFLQANCQFVVRENGDYAIHDIDPDILVDWDFVEQVRVNSHELPSCPICLQPPLAAKITKCGHIYCWACILHYLALGDRTWRKCPICYESIQSKDVKSVLTREFHRYKVGETVTLKLMKKEKGYTYALPMNIWRKSDGQLFNVEDSPEVTIHMKLLLAKPGQIDRLVIQPEKAELEKQLVDAETSEVAFIESALAALKERSDQLNDVRKIKERSDQLSDVRKIKEKMARREKGANSGVGTEKPEPRVVEFSPGSKNIKRYASAFSDEEEEVVETEVPTSPLHIVASCPELGVMSPPDSLDDTLTEGADDSPPPDTVKPDGSELQRPGCLPVEEAAESLELPETDVARRVRKSSSNAYYFYQAADGQPIFINALNARCLVKEYGSFENCPDDITASIVEIEHVFMSEELRRRLRYLSHLPLSSEFEVAELVLKMPVVSKETLKHFSAQIDHHRRLRQKKNREEKRWARKVEEEERQKFGIASEYVIVKSQFHQASTESSPATSTTSTPVGSPMVHDTEDTPTSPTSDEGQQTTNISFAQMLKGGKAKPLPAWPKAGPREPSESASHMTSKTSGSESDGSDNGDRVPVPEYQNSLGDAIEAAFVTLAKSKDYSEFQSPEKLPGKKKTKKKQTLLFATSMARGGK